MKGLEPSRQVSERWVETRSGHPILGVIQASSNGLWCSFLAHSSDIDDLLEGLDGVLEDGLDGLHDTESALHIVDLGLHALDGLHLAGNLDEGLAIIKSLQTTGGEGLLDVLDGSGLGDGGISITAGLARESSGEGGLCLLYTSPSPRDNR